MKRLLWLVFMPIVVFVVPFVGAWVSHGKTHAAVVALVWLALILIGAFVAIGPATIGLFLLAVFQLARTPWLPPDSSRPAEATTRDS